MRRDIATTLGTLLLATGLLYGDGRAQENRGAAQATARIINQEGKEIGTATLTEEPKGVRIEAQVSGLPRGEHGFHVHETGTCKTPDFESAGGHFNPTDKMHGMEVPTGPHAGDLPNVIVSADGSGRVNTLNPYLTLAQGSETSLIKEGGTALIVHAGSDDYDSQPTGGAGPRLACGEIQGG